MSEGQLEHGWSARKSPHLNFADYFLTIF